jgi:hypothetical protein
MLLRAAWISPTLLTSSRLGCLKTAIVTSIAWGAQLARGKRVKAGYSSLPSKRRRREADFGK